MSLRDQLQQIYDAHRELTPSLVVDTARDPGHPLHSRFEWNDEIAGEAYRREQAHRLIQKVKVRYAESAKGPKEVRAFVAVPRGNDPQPNYMPVQDAMADDFSRRLVLQAMERDIAALKRTYGHLKEFAAAISQLAQGA